MTAFELTICLFVAVVVAALFSVIVRMGGENAQLRDQLALSEQHVKHAIASRDEAIARAAQHAAARYAAEEREWALRYEQATSSTLCEPAGPTDETVRRKVGAL